MWNGHSLHVTNRGSQKRGLHSEGSAQLCHTQLFDGDPVKDEELHYEALNQVISIK